MVFVRNGFAKLKKVFCEILKSLSQITISSYDYRWVIFSVYMQHVENCGVCRDAMRLILTDSLWMKVHLKKVKKIDILRKNPRGGNYFEGVIISLFQVCV